MTWFDEPYKTACFWGVKEKSKGGNVSELRWCKFVEYFHVFPMSCLRRHKGPAVPERDLQKMDGEKISWETFFQTHEDARDQKIRTNSSGKTETPRREHSG